MFFWSRRGSKRTSTDGASALAVEPALEPIQLFLSDRIVNGSVVSDGERLTDMIASKDTLRINVIEDEWETFAIADVLVVAPPPHVSARRIHRMRRRIELAADPYVLTGTAHLPPGTQLDPFVMRTGQRTLPVTDVWLRVPGNEEIDQQLDVALVVVASITRARELLTSF